LRDNECNYISVGEFSGDSDVNVNILSGRLQASAVVIKTDNISDSSHLDCVRC
jgi:hypothetical protein